MSITEYLDQLDQARAAALTIRQGYPSLPQIVQNETEVEADWSDGGRSVLAECYGEDIAALIVAAVNALPKLTAALRAAQALTDKLDHDADARGYGDVAWGIRYATAEIRAALTDALGGEL